MNENKDKKGIILIFSALVGAEIGIGTLRKNMIKKRSNPGCLANILHYSI